MARREDGRRRRTKRARLLLTRRCSTGPPLGIVPSSLKPPSNVGRTRTRTAVDRCPRQGRSQFEKSFESSFGPILVGGHGLQRWPPLGNPAQGFRPIRTRLPHLFLHPPFWVGRVGRSWMEGTRSTHLVDDGWIRTKPWRTNRDQTVHETRSEGRNNATDEGGDVHGRKKTSTDDGTRPRDTPFHGEDEKESIVDETQSHESTPILDPYILDRPPSRRPHQVKSNPWQTFNAEK